MILILLDAEFINFICHIKTCSKSFMDIASLLPQPYEVAAITTSILEMKPRETKQLTQGHTAVRGI